METAIGKGDKSQGPDKTAGKGKTGERWLMTRKTWRYMSSKMALASPTSHRLDVPTPASHLQVEDDVSTSLQMVHHDTSSSPRSALRRGRVTSFLPPLSFEDAENLDMQANMFQELCDKQTEFHLPDASAFSYSHLLQQSRDSAVQRAEQRAELRAAAIQQQQQPQIVGDEERIERKDTKGLNVEEKGATSLPQEDPNDCFATQTEDHLFFDLDMSEIRAYLSSRASELAEEKNAKVAAAAAHAATPVFSDAVLKYFGMGRKKSTAKALDFRSVNYDRNLRNIKSKYVEEVKNKDFQSQEGSSFINFTTGSRKKKEPEKEEVTWDTIDPEGSRYGTYRPPTLMLSPSTPQTYKRKKSTAGFHSSSNPPSPPKAEHLDVDQLLPLAERSASTGDDINRSYLSLSLPLSPTSSSMYSAGNMGLNFQSFLSAVMHKSKSGGSLHHHHAAAIKESTGSGSMSTTATGSGHSNTGTHAGRLLSKKNWKTRSKSQSRASASSTCIWTPQGLCTWTSITGRHVVLTDTTLIDLTEAERITLQKVALAKLQALNMGVVVRTPTGSSTSSTQKPKRRAYLLRKRAFSSGTFFDGSKKDSIDKEGPHGGGQVFGIPIDQCVANERSARLQQQQQQQQQLQQQQQSGINDDIQSDNGDTTSPVFRKSSHGSRTSFSSLIEGFKFDKGGSCESLNADKNRRISLSCSLTDVQQAAEEDRSTFPMIPVIVMTCCNHLQAFGASKLGIFRVSSSKKRVRQLRESFDSGQEIKLDEECCPHDVATLLKEYFRDLPDPLLTRELYDAFVQTQRIRNRRLQMEALQHLIQLLPPANRDTLHCLLSFLAVVASRSNDHQTVDGVWEPGNKMDSNNLATLFAPNLLHTIKPGTSTEKLAAESVARAGERIDVINVIRCMIDHHLDVFKVSAELLDEVYIHMMDTHPDFLDRLLRRRCQSDENNDDLDTNSSVFEGSDCSSLKIPWTPGYEDTVAAASFDIETSPTATTTQHKWSQSSVSNQQQQVSNSEEQTQPHYRKRGDILHENGGTGGSTKPSEAIRERRKESNRSSEETTSSNTSKTTSSQSTPRSVLSRERSDPTMSISSTEARNKLLSQSTQKVVHSSRSSSDNMLQSNGLELSDRRLSSPLVGTSGVITASLRISVGNTTSPTLTSKNRSISEGKSFTVDNEHEIPFIEDAPSLSLSKSSSTASTEKRRDTIGKLNPSASARKGSISSPSPAVIDSNDKTHSSSRHLDPYKDGTGAPSSVSSTGVVRSKTVSTMYGSIERNKPITRSHLVMPASKEEWLKKDKQKSVGGAEASNTSTSTEESAASVKKKAKKKYVSQRTPSDSNLFSDVVTSVEAGDQPSSSRHKVASVVHKRWNLIASTSNPGGSSNSDSFM